ncbi:MAG: ywqD 2 [Pedosphaera sp.]|nr:ywqD 2 [Pedosphaera sp.]
MIAPAQNKLKAAAILFALGGLLVAAAGLLYLFLTPKSYGASAKIKVEKRDWLHAKLSANSRSPYDPGLVPAECQLLRSDAVLDQAIQNLGLIESWNKRYHLGTPLTADECRTLLKSKADIRPMPNSSLVEIKVTSEDSEETAKIANELARIYQSFRQTQRQDLIHSNIDLLKQQWDEQNLNVQAAQAEVDKLSLEINRARATNSTVFYDADSYDLLQAKRIELEGESERQRNELAQFKKLEPSGLRQVLSSLDPDPNSMLNAALQQLRQSKKEFAAIESDHAAGSPEFKHAQLMVNALDSKIGGIVSGIMTFKEADFAALEAALDGINGKLKNAKPTTQPDANLRQTPAYARAFQKLQDLKGNRDALQDKINSNDANEAFMPTAVTAEIMDAAETPSKPFIPDGRIAVGALGAAAFLEVVGAILVVISQRSKVVPRKA